MAKVLVLYKKAADAAAFKAHYFDRHVPIANGIPGLLSYEVSDGPVGTPAGPSPYELIATLTFDSMAALQGALASPAGVAAAQDVSLFAQAGVELLIFDTKNV